MRRWCPTSRAKPVPINTRIWLLDGGLCDGAALFDADDHSVEVKRTDIGHWLHVMTPAQPLILGKRYQIRGCSPLTNESFTVTGAEDLLPPSAPSIGEVSSSDGCGAEGHYEGDIRNLALGGFDLAGNFSGWGPATDMQDELSCHVSAAVPRSGHWAWLLAAVALGMLRRRRIGLRSPSPHGSLPR